MLSKQGCSSNAWSLCQLTRCMQNLVYTKQIEINVCVCVWVEKCSSYPPNNTRYTAINSVSLHGNNGRPNMRIVHTPRQSSSLQNVCWTCGFADCLGSQAMIAAHVTITLRLNAEIKAGLVVTMLSLTITTARASCCDYYQNYNHMSNCPSTLPLPY